jgi:hypothetical protein
MFLDLRFVPGNTYRGIHFLLWLWSLELATFEEKRNEEEAVLSPRLFLSAAGSQAAVPTKAGLRTMQDSFMDLDIPISGFYGSQRVIISGWILISFSS